MEYDDRNPQNRPHQNKIAQKLLRKKTKGKGQKAALNVPHSILGHN